MEKNNFLKFLLIFSFIFLLSIANDSKQQKKTRNVFSWVERTKEKCGEITEKEALDWCFRGILAQAVKEEGTQAAVSVLELLRNTGVINAEFDDHQHVHEIGRTTAKLKGLNVEAFLSCPSTFNYGCQHGFFEYALSQTETYEEAATSICENIGAESSPKLYSYCYHGVGHGLMMALAYNLDEVLEVCNKLPNPTAQEGCWQGSFMENSNAAVTDEEKVLGFSKNAPLAPCNRVEERYKWQCYINHAGYLMKVTNLDIKKAAEICLSAKESGSKPCIQSIGLMVTNPIWQKSVKGVDTARSPKKNVEIAWEMCRQLPEIALSDCVIGAVGNIHNFDETQVSRSSLFCDLVFNPYKKDCFEEIGKSVAGLVTNEAGISEICKKLSTEEGRKSCFNGAATRNPQFKLTSENDKRLVIDDKFLKEAVTKIGPSAVIDKLSQIMPQQGLSCHDRAHETGRFAYEVFGGEAFKSCSSKCHSGCYHGAAEAFFNHKGTANLEENLEIICQGQLNRFFRHQCLHGVGHGLMAWSNYELFDALSTCDQLNSFEDQTSCFTGVFMENIVGGLSQSLKDTHYTKYLTSDPQYPCNIVSDRYKGSCYFLQTSRMMQLFNTDFKKIASACLNAPENYRLTCFQSMGRDVGGTSKHNVRLAISKCQNAPFGIYRTECLSGAVQDTFWDPTGKEEALTFCSLLKDNAEAQRCYQTLADRASEVLAQKEYALFCQRIPNTSGVTCANKVNLASTKNQQTITNKKEVLSEVSNSKIVTIKISDSGYSPKNITVKKGTTVVFQNNSSEARWPASNIHPTHRIYPDFDPRKPVKKGQSWSFTFNKAGVWQFHDHLITSLTGKITVVE